MWYYAVDGKQIGPVNRKAIAKEVQAGTITAETLICSSGSLNWIRFMDSELITLLEESHQVTVRPSSQFVSSKSIQNPEQRLINMNSLARWCLGMVLASLLGDAILRIFFRYEYTTGLFIFLNLPLVLAGIPKFMLVYQFWSLMQDGFVRTKPGVAVGLLFVPFFSAYWIYKAYIELARSQNDFIERHYPGSGGMSVRKPNAWLSWSYGILNWAWVLFFIYTFSGVLVNDFSYQSVPWLIPIYDDRVSVIALTLFSAQLVVQVPMVIDFFLTARSILKKELTPGLMN